MPWWKWYLLLYNFWQWLAFSAVILTISVRYMNEGAESVTTTYEAVGALMKFSVLMSWLEVLHPLFGYTRGSLFHPFVQCMGRTTILFLLIDSESRYHKMPVVCFLFVAWAAVELVRYPFYMLNICDTSLYLVTWLRYTCWIILYPAGFLCEGTVILRGIPFFEETGRNSIPLPNKFNIAFHLPSVMRCYLLLFFLPAMYMMMSHMYKLRTKVIGPRPVDKRKNQ